MTEAYKSQSAVAGSISEFVITVDMFSILGVACGNCNTQHCYVHIRVSQQHKKIKKELLKSLI